MHCSYKIPQVRVDASVIVDVTSQVQNVRLVVVFADILDWHIPIKKLVKLVVTLPIVIDCSLSQIALSAIVQVKLATLFESEGIVPHHFHLFHDKTS
jgi:ABC-type sulfate transport system permease component